MHKVGQDPDHSTCMYSYNARHNNTGVLPTVVHLSYHAPRGRCVRLYAQRRCGVRDTGGAARARATLACEPFRHNTWVSNTLQLEADRVFMVGEKRNGEKRNGEWNGNGTAVPFPVFVKRNGTAFPFCVTETEIFFYSYLGIVCMYVSQSQRH